MAPDRRTYRREGEERRREALIAAALDLVAEGGSQAATVRAIADRAGVTPGLIRHYFQGKDDLNRAAYAYVMTRIRADSAAVLDGAGADPAARLAAFVAACLCPPVTGPAAVGLWAGFLHQALRDPQMRAVHEISYLTFRDMLQDLIAALPGDRSPEVHRELAIACNAVLDGLWLEGSILPEAFAVHELPRIGVASVGAILGIDLAAALPEPLTPT